MAGVFSSEPPVREQRITLAAGLVPAKCDYAILFHRMILKVPGSFGGFLWISRIIVIICLVLAFFWQG
jgi:hypothetical protein